MMHAWPDNMDISAYHGIVTPEAVRLSIPSHGSVRHPSRRPRPGREKWDNRGRIGYYLSPALTHYRSYHCFIADTNATRICDSVMFYPAPLVLPGASRFDQLLQLTERLATAASHDQPLYTE
jgi:hypothetical protein